MTVDWDGKIRMDCSSPYAMVAPARDARSFRCRVCQRYRRRPARNRHALERADEPESLPRGRDLVPVPQSLAMAQRRRGRQDRREQQHDRSRRGQPRTQAHRGPGRLQMVRGRADRRLGRIRRRGKRGRLVSAHRRHRVDDRQGRAHPRAAGGGDHRARRPRPRRIVQRPHREVRRAGLRTNRRTRDARAKENSKEADAGSTRPIASSRARKSSRR